MASCTFFWISLGLVSPGPSGLGMGRENSDLLKGYFWNLRARGTLGTALPAPGPIASQGHSGQCAQELLAVHLPTVGSPSVRRMIRETLPAGSCSFRLASSSSCTAISIALLMLVPERRTFSGWLPGRAQCPGTLHPAGLQRHSPPWAWMSEAYLLAFSTFSAEAGISDGIHWVAAPLKLTRLNWSLGLRSSRILIRASRVWSGEGKMKWVS